MEDKPAYKILNILESIRADVISGRSTIAEATSELLEAGWMNFYDEEKTKRMLRIKEDNMEVRLINAKAAEGIIWERSEELMDEGSPVLSGALAASIGYLDKTPTVDAIPVAVMKRELSGIGAADLCDQAGRYDIALRSALELVLEWYKSPRYKETEERCKI